MGIYSGEVTPAAAVAAPAILQHWSGWEDLRGAGRDRRTSAGPGLYRIRRCGGEPSLDYVGQTGRSLRARLGQLNGVYHAEMPYRDPHTAAPALWALRHRDGSDFEVAVIEIPGTAPERKALEATAITLYRMDSGRSPTRQPTSAACPPVTRCRQATMPGWWQLVGAAVAARIQRPQSAPPAHRSQGCPG